MHMLTGDRTIKNQDDSKADKGVTTGRNLLMELPSELRNTIYSLALLHSDSESTIYDRTIWVRSARPHAPSGLRIAEWSEPGLLRTCKQIRREAMLTYVLRHNWTITLTMGEMDRLYSWLSRMVEQIGGRWPDFTLRILPSREKGGDLALMKLAYGSTTINKDEELIEPSMHVAYQLARQSARKKAIYKLVERVQQAKFDGKSLEVLEMELHGLEM